MIVRRFANDGNKIFTAVIDCALRTERYTGMAFFFRARGNKNTGAQTASNLNRRCANARRTAVYQHHLTRLELGPMYQVAPNRKKCLR